MLGIGGKKMNSCQRKHKNKNRNKKQKQKVAHGEKLSSSPLPLVMLAKEVF